MNIPTNPMNYKTRKGLFDAFCRVLSCPSCVSRSWWLTNAEYAASKRMPDLLPQMRRVKEEASPKNLDDLIPMGSSR